METAYFFQTDMPSVLDNQGTIELGNNSFITKNYRILNRGKIVIGTSSYINPNSVIRIEKALIIGDHCAISWNCTFLDTNHHKINGEDVPNEITIGNNVWIGANTTMLKGSAIGDNCIVAAGSIVTKKFGSNLLIGGVPARIIKKDINWEK